MPVVAIGGDDLIAGLQGHLHADDDRFLPDVEVAEAADVPHAVELAGLLLEAADQQHRAVGRKLLLARKGRISGSWPPLARGRDLGGGEDDRTGCGKASLEPCAIPRVVRATFACSRLETRAGPSSRSLQEPIGDGQNARSATSYRVSDSNRPRRRLPGEPCAC